MFPDLDPTRLRAGRLAAMVMIKLLGWIVPLCLGLCSFVWLYHFYPSQRIELRSAAGNHRAFVENAGFLDAAYLLQASDWPWTFSQPFIVANLAYWPEARYASTSHWTRDGSALVFATRLTSDSAPEIVSGYDFRNHRGWTDSGSSFRPAEMERWLAACGGLGPDLGFQDWKSVGTDQEKDYPRWIWGAALGVLGGTRWAAVRLVKKRFYYPKNTRSVPE